MDYSTVTETPGDRIRKEALSELYTRYGHAAALCDGRDVLEVGCGAGTGLGILAARARRVVGGDRSALLAARARQPYHGRIPIVQLDAEQLPFRDQCFDVILLFEAIYYLNNPTDFYSEAKRLLRPGGVIVICTSNRESRGFNPSPYSTHYPTAGELDRDLRAMRFITEVYGAFPQRLDQPLDRLLPRLRQLAVTLHLIPRTMKGKTLLKRLFYGPLVSVPAMLPAGEIAAQPLEPLTHDQDASRFQVLYAFGRIPW